MIIEIITPCYNEQKCIRPFYEAIEATFEKLPGFDFLITFVDDGSKDGTLDEIKKLADDVNVKEQSNDQAKIRYISLSRNFGKEPAMYAGLSNATGDLVCIMDVDLQHPPVLLSEMIDAIIKEGYDCATARRVSRKGEGKIRSAMSKSFYYVFNAITSIELVPGATDYRLMKLEVARAILEFSERERFTKGIYSWMGYKNKWIEYRNVERENGTTKWSIFGLFKYAINGFMSFATTPLRSMVWLGFFIVVIDMIQAIRIFFRAINDPASMGSGYNTIILVIMFFGGLIVMLLGLIGEYLARIYLEVKRRPIYLVRETNIAGPSIKEAFLGENN